MKNVFLQKGKCDDWFTPKELYNYFINDLCCEDPCKLYELDIHDNLFNDFGDVNLFINPPYSKLKDWVEFAIFNHRIYKRFIFLLLPVRSDAIAFKKLYDYGTNFIFIKGRISFGDSKNKAPFASVICLINGCCSYIHYIDSKNLVNELNKIIIDIS